MVKRWTGELDMYVDGVSMSGVLFHSARITLISMKDASAFSSLVSTLTPRVVGCSCRGRLSTFLRLVRGRSPIGDWACATRVNFPETKPRHGSPTPNSSSLRQLTMVEMFFKGINVASVGWADAIVCGLRSWRRSLQASLLARYALTY